MIKREDYVKSYLESLHYNSRFAATEVTKEVVYGYYKFLGLFVLNEDLYIGLLVSIITIFISQLYPTISGMF